MAQNAIDNIDIKRPNKASLVTWTIEPESMAQGNYKLH
jgi:hypothetical protein